PLDTVVAGRLKEKVLAALAGAQGLVVSDYDKGGISADLLAAVLPEAARRRLPIVVDPKVRLFPHYRPATVVTPNAREAMEAAGPSMEEAALLSNRAAGVVVGKIGAATLTAQDLLETFVD